jgi:hypothetical protein
MADVGRKAIALVKQSVRELLERRMSPEQADAAAEKLSTGTWTHDYPIWARTAKDQPVRAQAGGVEYLPNLGRGRLLGAHPTRCHDRNGPQGE